VSGLSRRFGNVLAVDDISLCIPAGITMGLLGPNASGKTTLLRLLAGVLRPTAGTVRIFGGTPGKRQPSAIGYMAQSTALVPILSAWENMRLFAGLQGVRAKRDMEEALADVALSAEMHRPMQHLSGGMQRRASFACATVHRPRLLLLDEPTVGLDPAIRQEFWRQFRRLNEAGVAIVLSTHAMDEAALCDDLVILRNGRLIAHGAPAQLQRELRADSIEAAFVRLTDGHDAH
jgi:ABC-2 type transport system ATP-binding protein